MKRSTGRPEEPLESAPEAPAGGEAQASSPRLPEALAENLIRRTGVRTCLGFFAAEQGGSSDTAESREEPLRQVRSSDADAEEH